MASFNLTETVDQLSDKIIKKINADKNKQKRQAQDWRLRNTKLLLKNYHMLKQHCADVSSELLDYEESIFDPSELEIKSIMASKAKTRRMVWYIDSMLDAYQTYAHLAGESAGRRYDVLVNYYIRDARLNHESLARTMHVSDRTVRRDLEDARKEFGIFLFGIFAIEDLIEE